MYISEFSRKFYIVFGSLCLLRFVFMFHAKFPKWFSYVLACNTSFFVVIIWIPWGFCVYRFIWSLDCFDYKDWLSLASKFNKKFTEGYCPSFIMMEFDFIINSTKCAICVWYCFYICYDNRSMLTWFWRVLYCNLDFKMHF